MAAVVRERNDNAFKIGLFGANCAGGLAFVKAPEQWDASWKNNLTLARLADDVGLECIVANARWKGYGGDTENNLFSFESITWAPPRRHKTPVRLCDGPCAALSSDRRRKTVRHCGPS